MIKTIILLKINFPSEIIFNYVMKLLAGSIRDSAVLEVLVFFLWNSWKTLRFPKVSDLKLQR
jgi:hypothetical protein